MNKNIFELYVNFENSLLETDRPIKLVQNDNESTIFHFNFKNEIDEESYKTLTFRLNDGSGLIYELDNNNYLVPIEILHLAGTLEFELSLYNSEEKKTNYATGEAYVRATLINSDEIVEPDDRVPILDDLIERTIEATGNANDVAEDLETKRDQGFFNGKSLEYDWQDTSLGVRQEGQQEYDYTDLKGETGDCNFFTFDIVDGELIMYKTDDVVSGVTFIINDSGELVEIMEVV